MAFISSVNVLLLFFVCAFSPALRAEIEQRVLLGQQAASVIPAIAEMTSKEFAGFPYLYKSEPSDYVDYFSWMIREVQDTVFVVAYDGDTCAGYACALGLKGYSARHPAILETFIKDGVDTDKTFYLSECVVLESYRKKGLAFNFYKALATHALAKGYTQISCITEHIEEGTVKPGEYLDLSLLLSMHGGKKLSTLFTLEWPTIQPDGTVINQMHSMDCWIGSLT